MVRRGRSLSKTEGPFTVERAFGSKEFNFRFAAKLPPNPRCQNSTVHGCPVIFKARGEWTLPFSASDRSGSSPAYRGSRKQSLVECLLARNLTHRLGSTSAFSVEIMRSVAELMH